MGADLKSAYSSTIGKSRLGQSLASGAQSVSNTAGRFANRMRQSAQSGGIARAKDAAWKARHPIRAAKGERRDSAGASRLSGGDSRGADASKSQLSGGEAPGTKPSGGGEGPQSEHDKKSKELDLKQELSSPDHRPQDQFKGTGEILDGMDTEE